MRNGLYILLILVSVWRVGSLINWDITTFADKLSNDFESSYQIPTDSCLDVSKWVWGQGIYCHFRAWSKDFKSLASGKVQEVLPSPHSELVMGMVLGENRFKLVPRYNDVLKKVGLVHVVVVSGYNISLVFTLLMRVLGSQYKVKNLVVGLFITFIYAGISGFGIPSVRAWIMGTIAVIFKFYGRPTQGIKVLVFSAVFILVLAPVQLFSVSFQLSFLATIGVMLVPDAIKTVTERLGLKASHSFLEDFYTSLGAQLMVNPIISYYFGTISLAALVVNPLVLWVVPICTILGGLLALVVLISPLLSRILALIIFPFLDFFVSFSEFFSDFNNAFLSIRFEPYAVLVYYGLLFSAIKYLSYRRRM